MRTTTAIIGAVVLLFAAACSSSDSGSSPDTSAVVQIDVDPAVVDELVTICTETQPEFDELTNQLNEIADLDTLGPQILAVLDERIERLEEVDAGVAVTEVNELIGGYEEHRDVTASSFEDATGGDVESATEALADGLLLIGEINQGWARLGAEACVVELD